MTSDKKPFKLNLWALAKDSNTEINNEPIDIKKDTIEVINDVKKSDKNTKSKISMNKIKLDSPNLKKEIITNETNEIVEEKEEDIIKENKKEKDDDDIIIEVIEDNKKDDDIVIEVIEEEIKEKQEDKEKEKNTEKDDDKKEIKEEKNNENSEVLENNKKNIQKDKKSNKLDLNIMKDNKSKKEDNIKEIEKLKKDKIEKIEKDKKLKEENNNKESEDLEWVEVFENYESDFNKDKGSVLDKIKKIKDIVRPKTRVWFLIFITLVTILWIALLFLFVPEKHNLKTYETNLKIWIWKIECSYDSTKCPKSIIKEIPKVKEIVDTNSWAIKETENTNSWAIKEIIETKKESIKKWIFTIEYEIKIINWEEVIIYKWKNYNNINDFNIIVEKEINLQKKEQLKDYILNLEK